MYCMYTLLIHIYIHVEAQPSHPPSSLNVFTSSLYITYHIGYHILYICSHDTSIMQLSHLGHAYRQPLCPRSANQTMRLPLLERRRFQPLVLVNLVATNLMWGYYSYSIPLDTRLFVGCHPLPKYLGIPSPRIPLHYTTALNTPSPFHCMQEVCNH
jgi:hypothetical protein